MTSIDLSHLRKFMTSEVVFGSGARHLVGKTMAKFDAHHVLLVSDPQVIESGWTADVITSLEDMKIQWTLYSDVTPNPRTHEVMKGSAVYRVQNCDALVAVGGGSVIDCAKGIGIVVANGGHILDYEGADLLDAPMPPLVCVPTTGGTSADVSQFAIFSDLASQRKFTVISKAVVPDVTLVDPETLLTTAPYLVACTGMDALTHAIEAFVSKTSSPLTDLHALNAIKLLSENLQLSLQSPHDRQFRHHVMLASLDAGLAFSNASLGATHAMSHSLGGLLDLPHGECNSLVLSHVIEFNFAAEMDRFQKVGEALGVDFGGMNIQERKTALIKKIDSIRHSVGIDSGLKERGVRRSDIKQLAEHAIGDICLVTNPRTANRRDIEVIYEEAL